MKNSTHYIKTSFRHDDYLKDILERAGELTKLSPARARYGVDPLPPAWHLQTAREVIVVTLLHVIVGMALQTAWARLARGITRAPCATN